jgi:hypothetical protein
MALALRSDSVTTESVGLSRSARVALQSRFIAKGNISASELSEAIAADLDQGVALSETFITKFLLATDMPSDLRSEITSKIQARMGQVLFCDPVLFLNYSKAAVLIARPSVVLS